ncbi:MAG: hypothetical protein ACI957_005730 [Verrucomicrobiales bacterium]|jgi:hypothetical protein
MRSSPFIFSTTAAYWVDRVYRQIARDDRFRYPQFVFHSKDQNSSSQNAISGNLESVFIDQIEHTHDAMIGPPLVDKAAWEQLDLTQCLRDLGFNNKQITAAASSVMSTIRAAL